LTLFVIAALQMSVSASGRTKVTANIQTNVNSSGEECPLYNFLRYAQAPGE